MSPTGPVNADRELWGQGLASLAAGFFGDVPATRAIARTAMIIRVGTQTRLATVIHALFLLLVVLDAAPVVSVIPLAALAGVLMVTAARMVSLETFRRRSLPLNRCYYSVRGPRGRGSIQYWRGHTTPFTPAEPGRISLTIADTAAITVTIIKLTNSTGATTLAELIDDLRTNNTTVFLVGTRPEHHTLLRQATHATKALSPAAVAEARKVNAKLGHQGKNM